MRREQSDNRERALAPGDEELDWRTYSDLWRDHLLTRGALDVLVFAGKVPWVTGGRLIEFLHHSPHGQVIAAMEAAVRLGGDTTFGLKADQTYYAVGAFLLEYQAGEAASRLRGGEEHSATELYRETLPLLRNVRLFDGEKLPGEEVPPHYARRLKR